jgi:hypothetical protein
MLVAFLWFTIGATFVVVVQIKYSLSLTASKDHNTDTEKTPDPFANSSEEKTEHSPGVFEYEYLRVDNENLQHTGITLKHYKYHNAEIFAAFYGESVSPPPEVSFC